MNAPMHPDTAVARLRQYQERPAPTWSTASYGSSAAESTLAEIGRTLADEVERLRTELDAERKRAAELREREAAAHDQLAAAVGVASSMVWPDLVARVAELDARPTRADVLREAADALAEDDYLGAAEELRELADAEPGGAR